MMNKFAMATIAAALLAIGVSPARANDCEANAAKAVSTLGATIINRGYSIDLQHDAVPEPGQIKMECGDEKTAIDLFMSWHSNNRRPTDSFFSLAGALGAIVTGKSSKDIEYGARTCFATSKAKGEADFIQSDVHFSCGGGEATQNSFMLMVDQTESAKAAAVARPPLDHYPQPEVNAVHSASRSQGIAQSVFWLMVMPRPIRIGYLVVRAIRALRSLR